MRKNKKDDLILTKFKLNYESLFNNESFLSLLKNHFNKNAGFAAFILMLVQEQVGIKKLQKHINAYLKEWIRLFADLYDDLTIIDTYKSLSLNPIIPLVEIKREFNCFDKIIDKVFGYLKFEHLITTLDEQQIKNILKTGLGFLLYNSIDCRIKYSFEDILSDPLYDMKLTMITNNTNLFADAKSAIIDSCGTKINDLITILLGASKDLNYDK